MELTIGSTDYRLTSDDRNGRIVTYAVRLDNGDRFGIEVNGTSVEDTQSTLARWLQWQYEHSQALATLQQAERVYHKAMAGAAFGATPESAAEESRSAVEAMNEARTRLDEIRLRRPNI